MHANRQLLLSILAFTLTALSASAVAQQVIATVPVGTSPYPVAVNPMTNKIYVANLCGPTCSGTVTVIDGATDNTATVNVGTYPYDIAVNSTTNKIYVANSGDPNGTVTVIDGATLSTTTVAVGHRPSHVAVNSITNKIYVSNYCGDDPNCSGNGTVTVIDGATLSTSNVTVGIDPQGVAINTLTNKIYVANSSGEGPGTVTVIDGATLFTTSIPVGVDPLSVAVNSVTNKIYIVNNCGDDPFCGSLGTVTVIDGVTNNTVSVNVGAYPLYGIAVDAATNKIYVANDCGDDLFCETPPGTVTVIDGSTNNTTNVNVGFLPTGVAVNSMTNKVYVTNAGSHTATVIDGASLATTDVGVGDSPSGVAVNSSTNRIYVANSCGNDPSCQTQNGTVSVIDGTPPSPLQFVSLEQPCRAVDTRPQYGGAGPIQGGTSQDFVISGSSACGTLPSAAAYAMNVTVVPQGRLGYLTVWPTGQPQPLASTLNSLDGRVKANAAIMPAGTAGKVSVYATDTTQVIIDINGYFAPPSGSTLAFYPLAPCRVADTRKPSFPTDLGPPSLTGGKERVFPILNASTTCDIPMTAQAFSLNFTVVPHGPLGYLTVWPTGQLQPRVSTLNDVLGLVIANAAIVVAGDSSGDISAYATNDTDLIIDINGYFAPAGTGGLSLYGVSPCRVIDTRKIGAGQPFSGTLSPPVDVFDAGCAASSLAQAYVFNASVIPSGSLGYLTMWPDGEPQPTVSTLNSVDGSITSNMAIVPTALMPPGQGYIDAFANGITQLFLDLSSYFAP